MSDVGRAARAFLARHDALVKDIDGIFVFAAVHGVCWTPDKTWAPELTALRDAVAREPLDTKSPILARLDLRQAYGDLLWVHRQALSNWLLKTAALVLAGQRARDAQQFLLEAPEQAAHIEYAG